MNKKLTISLVASALIATNLLSNEITISSATKSEQSIQDVTSNVEVITKEQLEDRNISSVSEALKLSSSVIVSSSGGLGQQTSFFLRGFDTESTLVLVNGVSYNDPTNIGNTAQLDHLMVTDIERIEIIKGAQSGIYGSNATAGVINIITKQASKELSTNINVEIGSFGTRKINTSFSKKIDDLSFYVGINKIDTDGFSARASKDVDLKDYEDDAYSNLTINSNVKYLINDNNELNLIFNTINAKAEYDNSLTNQDGHEITQKNKIFNVNYKYLLNTKDFLKVSYSKTKFKKEDPTGWTKKFDGFNNEVAVDSKFTYLDNSFVLIGANNKTSEDKISGNELKSKGIYLTNNNKFEKLVLTQTLRKDSYDTFEDKITGKVGAKYSFSSDSSIFTNMGSAYNTPSLYNLYDTWSGNTSLEPETVKSKDVGFEYKGSKVTYFTNKIENEIVYNSTTWKYANSDSKSYIKGLEYSYKKLLNMNTLLNFDYTYFSSKDEEGYQLARRPKYIANVSVDYYGFTKTHINLNTQIVGKRVEYTYGTHNVSAQTGKYAVVNAVVNHNLSKNQKVYFKMDNILNKEYQIVNDYATAPRSVYMGLNLKF